MEGRSSTNGRSDRISRLLSSQESRVAYIKAKLAVLVPAQIRALRLRSTNPPMPKQSDLARQSAMHQSRISMFETPGAANITLETLSKVAAGLRCGVVVKFAPFSEMLRWENSFSPDLFNVPRIEEDYEFIRPASSHTENARCCVASSSQNENAAGSVMTFGNAAAESRRRPVGGQMAASAVASVGAR